MRRLALLLLLSLSACDEFLDNLIPCEVLVPSSLDGQWTLRGEGVRTGCADPRFDGDFTIATAAPLDVEQDNDFNGTATLRLGTPVPGFTLTGGLADQCSVSFDVVEENPEGQVTYHFVGEPDTNDGVEHGTLTGEGPGSCRLTGSFEVTIER